MEDSLNQNEDSTAPNVEIEAINGPKERHGCVTTYLILMIIANSFAALLYLLASERIAQNLPGDASTITIILLGLIGVANVIFSVMLLQWKKIGFWGFVVSSILALIINISLKIGMGSLIGLLGLIILYAVLQISRNNVSAWDNME